MCLLGTRTILPPIEPGRKRKASQRQQSQEQIVNDEDRIALTTTGPHAIHQIAQQEEGFPAQVYTEHERENREAGKVLVVTDTCEQSRKKTNGLLQKGGSPDGA